MQFTTVRSKEKDYDMYLKSEKLVHRNQEHEKNVSQLFGSGKYWFLPISSLKNTVAAIWIEKKVDPCHLEAKKCSSQLFGARKKIMTSIKSQKICFPAIQNWKKLVPSYFEPDKHCCSYLVREKSGICYLETKKCSSQQLGARKKIMTCI